MDPPRILSLYPTTRGFGYAVFEGPGFLVDWGVRQYRPEAGAQQIASAQILIGWYRPDLIVTEDYAGLGSRRAPRICGHIRAIRRIARKLDIPAASYSRAQIRQYFSRFGVRSKDAIARVIAREFPELAPRLPPPRKPWMSEDYRMGMFDAAALALTHFHFASKER